MGLFRARSPFDLAQDERIRGFKYPSSYVFSSIPDFGLLYFDHEVAAESIPFFSQSLAFIIEVKWLESDLFLGRHAPFSGFICAGIGIEVLRTIGPVFIL
jgi:hypothetical protein